MSNNYQLQLKEFLETAIKEKASDLHISADYPPMLRVAGELIPILKTKKLLAIDTWGLAQVLMTEDQKTRLLKEKEIDFSYKFGDYFRFRINIFFREGSIAIALRLIPAKIKTIEELNLPSVLHRFTKASQGFVLITGASGQGKSTTMAALIEEIARTNAKHIITIEDPIEYIFSGSSRCIIDQREVYQDTQSFARALRATFRQDPDIVMVGEMRDPETIATTLTIAETGHLVFSTLHTNSATQTIHRIVDSFPSDQQNQIRSQLSSSLLGIISQRLLPKIGGGLIPACEVMFSTPAVGNLIRENKIHELPLVIETSAEKGMISLNQSLISLIKKGEISLENGLNYSLNPSEIKMFIDHPSVSKR
jgi:twitching motility protein PilT